MAMLEAFIHDPLIKWRLLQPQPPQQPPSSTSSQSHLSSKAASLGDRLGIGGVGPRQLLAEKGEKLAGPELRVLTLLDGLAHQPLVQPRIEQAHATRRDSAPASVSPSEARVGSRVGSAHRANGRVGHFFTQSSPDTKRTLHVQSLVRACSSGRTSPPPPAALGRKRGG